MSKREGEVPNTSEGPQDPQEPTPPTFEIIVEGNWVEDSGGTLGPSED
jgi:hypothetical protein